MQGTGVLGAADDRPPSSCWGGHLGDEFVLDGILAVGQHEVGCGDPGKEARTVVVDRPVPGPAGDVHAAHPPRPHGTALGLGAHDSQLHPVHRRPRADVRDPVDVAVPVDLEGGALPSHITDAGHEPLRAGHLVDRVRDTHGRVPEVGQLHVQADSATDDLGPGTAHLQLVGLHELGGAVLPDEVVRKAAPRWELGDHGRVDVGEVLTKDPHEGLGELLVALVQDVEEERHVEGEDLLVVQPLAVDLARALEEAVDRGDRSHPVDEVAALGATLGDRLLGGLAFAPEVDRLLDEVHGPGQEVRWHRQGDVLVEDALGETQPVLDEELSPEDLVPRGGVVQQ